VFPLVTVVAPSLDPRWLPLLRRWFDAQDYPRKELRVDDETTPLGAARNRLASLATDIVAHFDPDDWQSPQRLTLDTAELLAGAAVVGTSRLYVYDLRTRCAALSVASEPWCRSLTYWRSAWQRRGFDQEAAVGEARGFLAAHRGATVDAGLTTRLVALLHDHNTAHYPPIVGADPRNVALVRRLMGKDFDQWQ
jgi:hypothetical protein